MYEGNPGEIDFGSSWPARFELARVRVIGSSSYRESTVSTTVDILTITLDRNLLPEILSESIIMVIWSKQTKLNL